MSLPQSSPVECHSKKKKEKKKKKLATEPFTTSPSGVKPAPPSPPSLVSDRSTVPSLPRYTPPPRSVVPLRHPHRYKGAAGSLDDSYRRKVNLEFISAVKDAGARATAGPGRCGDGSSAGSGNHPDGAGDAEAANAAAADDDADDADDDSAMDSAMDMMLDAVNDGYGDFEDDYEDDYEEGGSPGTAQHPADDCDADSDDDDEEGGVLGADDDDSDGDADTARKRQKKTG